MTIYLDADFRCHLDSADGRQEVETDFFDGKCKTYIEGYRFVPDGQIWTRADGVAFRGQMATPAVELSSLVLAQQAYEESQQILNDTLSRIEVALGI